MDFEDNNPLGVTSDDEPRRRAPPSPAANDDADRADRGASSQAPRVVISEAGKSREGSSRGHISYTIRVGDTTVRRRYSEFESLRKLLRRLLPCVVVPSIPEKHSLGAYAANPAHAHEDSRVIEHRQRTLANFLNRCIAIPQIKDSWVLERFLDPNTSWRELLQSERVQRLPASPLQAPPVDPAAATPAHAFLPIPAGAASLARPAAARATATATATAKATARATVKAAAKAAAGATKGAAAGAAGAAGDAHIQTAANNTANGSNGNAGVQPQSQPAPQPAAAQLSSSPGSSSSAASYASASSQPQKLSADSASFDECEVAAKEYERLIGSGLEKRARKINRHYSALAVEYADLGGQFNSFSLDSHGQFDKFAPAVERVGQAVDQGYISTTHLVNRLSIEFSEPLAESAQLAATARQILKYRRQRALQVQIIKDGLERQTRQLADLQAAESEAQRMNAYLHADDRIAAATAGSAIAPDAEDRDHVVDQDGVHDHDHEIEHSRAQPEASPLLEAKGGLPGDLDSGDESTHSIANADEEPEEFNGDDTASVTSSLDDESLVPSPTPRVQHPTSQQSQQQQQQQQQQRESPRDQAAATSQRARSALRRGFKLPGLAHINQAIHGIMDVDPQTSRRNTITRLQERIEQLQAALEVAEQDAEVASREVSGEIARYNEAKLEDIRGLVRAFVRCHIEWAEKNLESWIEAKQAIVNS